MLRHCKLHPLTILVTSVYFKRLNVYLYCWIYSCPLINNSTIHCERIEQLMVSMWIYMRATIIQPCFSFYPLFSPCCLSFAGRVREFIIQQQNGTDVCPTTTTTTHHDTTRHDSCRPWPPSQPKSGACSMDCVAARQFGEYNRHPPTWVLHAATY